MKKPNLFIVGQPKSGTTALHQFLGQHPEIYMASIKEPHFFCDDFHQESDRYHQTQLFFDFREEKDYLKLFTKIKNEKIAGESSTQYLYSQVAAQKIYEFNPEAKIIIILREPATFLYSLHSHYVKFTEENEENFIKALTLESVRKSGKMLSPRVTSPSYLYYSERIKYYEQVKRYYDIFNSSQIKVILFEDFKNNNEQTYQEILKFLQVNPNFSPQYEAINVNKEVKFKALNNLANNQIIKNITKNIFSQEFNEFVRDKIVERFFWSEAPKSFMPKEIKIQLMKKFQPEVIRISELLGVDLVKQWGYDEI
ncbi:sulfotransferase [Stanieria cyanosphaera PCC 7437]|uniref:Sulfotransferase n=1 Tax=Stanieria cyanosphaera (strain ATCC 29371 / PCC 7437) TaxID=111780 RepID=K9XTJ3_STAC7|nr:sulfotransferase [Stanieria cyanosphaera]AFZ34987.1 sulfotransferase [Stanieria cyanosphaera PCC 7437]